MMLELDIEGTEKQIKIEKGSESSQVKPVREGKILRQRMNTYNRRVVKPKLRAKSDDFSNR